MKILVLTNLYPPHHAGTFDYRCQTITEALKLRGHTVRVLTSNHGLMNEQRGGEVERRLHLNGVYNHAPVSRLADLRITEIHNHQVLREVTASFKPDLIHCFSLRGLSKSLIFALRNSRIPTVYDIADGWLAEDLRNDPWLRFWNQTNGPIVERLHRTFLEISGSRNRLDAQAPTRMMKGYERLPQVYGKDTRRVEPNSISAFRFDRLYFCSQALKDATAEAGFRVNHADVIHPGISTQNYVGDVKAANALLSKFLIVAHLDSRSGALTAVRAFKKFRDKHPQTTLSIHGQGDSEYIAEIRSFIAVHQLQVEFLPISNIGRDLPAIYRRHDALIYPVEWNEPFSLVPLEAMACGLPIIGAAAGGASELFRHGENALTYPSGDDAALALQMEALREQPELRNRIAETAQQDVLSKYNETAVMDRIENYLQTSLEVWAHTAS